MMDIHDIAAMFESLFPSDVDTTPVGFGRGQEAGYAGHEGDDDRPAAVGVYYGPGMGHGVMAFPAGDVERAAAVIRGVSPPATLMDVERALEAAGVPYERLI